MSNPPYEDLLITGVGEDPADYIYFPDRIRDNKDFRALEGQRFRDVYVTNRAIETGSYVLFQILYRTAVMCHGRVLHISDYDFGAYR